MILKNGQCYFDLICLGSNASSSFKLFSLTMLNILFSSTVLVRCRLLWCDAWLAVVVKLLLFFRDLNQSDKVFHYISFAAFCRTSSSSREHVASRSTAKNIKKNEEKTLEKYIADGRAK